MIDILTDLNEIYELDCKIGLGFVPDKSINCCVTSPPYYGLRDYGTANWIGGNETCKHEYQMGGRNPETSGKQLTNGGTNFSQYKNVCPDCGAIRIDDQIGLEDTPEIYVQKLVEIFREVKRVLKADGTLWLNLGDSYAGSGKGGQSSEKRSINWQPKYGNKGQCYGLKPKDLIGIPWMVAFALRADGWYLRQDIIWHKPNPMPESVTDRCTKSHEYIFLMSKSSKYCYDAEAIKEPTVTNDDSCRNRDITKLNNTPGRTRMGGLVTNDYENRNKRSVWTVTTKPYKESHFATFPEELIVDCIKAGCPENGIILDPFMGAGTTGLVARKLNRNYIGFELNPKYIEIANRRIAHEIGVFG
jgi:DNA modification methylase